MKRINRWLALKITAGVGTMWCAYAFAALALLGLPAAIRTGSEVAWFAQTFLQLVLLSILAVGQRVQSSALDRHHDAIHARLDAHHERLTAIHDHVTRQRPAGRTRKETAP